MQVAVAAFRTGVYAGFTYSGKYGDLQATIAALLLDREGRSTTLDAAPTHGQMREPWIKLMHALRSLEFQFRDGRELDLTLTEELIGQRPHAAPSVFNFYNFDFTPDGPIKQAGLVAPEGELFQGPFSLHLQNGLNSLVETGMSDCKGGLTAGPLGFDEMCHPHFKDSPLRSKGLTRYTPEQGADADAVVDDLSLLLSAGRLSDHSRERIRAACANETEESSSLGGFQLAQKLILASPEFHVTNANRAASSPRPAPLPPPRTHETGSPDYKAVVFVGLFGGLDSFNLLVPHTGCTDGNGAGYDYHAAYTAARGVENALPKAALLTIDTSRSVHPQPCSTMGVPAVGAELYKRLYDDADLAFFANVGCLIEPLTLEDLHQNLHNRSVHYRRKRVCPSFGSHSTAWKSMQTLDPETHGADGVLGRMFKVLDDDGTKTGLYAFGGHAAILTGGPPVQVVGNRGQTVKLVDRPVLNESGLFDGVYGQRGSSVFAETHSAGSIRYVHASERLGAVMDTQVLSQNFAPLDGGPVRDAYANIAKIIKGRGALGAQRDAFVTGSRGFDGHASASNEALHTGVGTLETFINELKSEPGLWNNVTIVVMSEFGRTISSNGRGTDHGWGGNVVVMGGAVDGGKIFGKFPQRLGEDSEVNIGRGRLIPTRSWESVWNGVAEWLGVSSCRMHEVLPNLPNFPTDHIYTKNELYQGGGGSCPSCAPSNASPSDAPTANPPSNGPTTPAPTTAAPTAAPTTPVPATATPTGSPTLSPTKFPSLSPSLSPTLSPTIASSVSPTLSPMPFPTQAPTTSPSTIRPTEIGEPFLPTSAPTSEPSNALTPAASDRNIQPRPDRSLAGDRCRTRTDAR